MFFCLHISSDEAKDVQFTAAEHQHYANLFVNSSNLAKYYEEVWNDSGVARTTLV